MCFVSVVSLIIPCVAFYSLTKDMTGKEDVYRGPAIRALCRITDVSAVSFHFLSCPFHTISSSTLSFHARKKTSSIYYLIHIIKKMRHRLFVEFPPVFFSTDHHAAGH